MAAPEARRFDRDMDMRAKSTRQGAERANRVIALANQAALETLLDTHAGTWVAHAAGDADLFAVDTLGGLDVPPANSQRGIRSSVEQAKRMRILRPTVTSSDSKRWSAAVA
jgi:hypothetical protein